MIYRLHYSDGRSSLHSLDDLIYTKQGKYPIKSLIQNFIPLEIDFYPVKYRHILRENINPDPYITGTLITYGDLDNQYVNLPLGLVRANSYFSHKYLVDYGMKMEKNLVFFSFIHSKEIITWKDFFFDKLKDETLKYHHIPFYMKRATVEDRWQYVRGVFDVGYSEDIFSKSECGIGHFNKSNLEEFQLMLWSLGVSSSIEKIEWDNMNRFRYRLLLNESSDRFPEFFYNISLIEKMIVNRTTIIKYPYPVPSVRLTGITVEGEGAYRELILDKPSVYIQSDFLPRVSL